MLTQYLPTSTRICCPRQRRVVGLESFRSTSEETAVNGVNDWLSTNLPTTKETPVQSLDRVLAALHPIEFEIDVTLSIRI